MNARSILAGATVLLLASVALPESIVLSPAPAYAQDLSAAAQAALSDETPAESLDRAVLAERVKALREAIRSGALKGAQRKAAQAKMRAYRQAMKAAKREQAAEEKPAATASDSADAGTDTPDATGEEEPAAQASTEAAGDAGSTAEILQDKRAAPELDTDALRTRLKGLRQAIKSGELKGAQRRAAADMLKADRQELRKRRDGKSTEPKETAVGSEQDEPAGSQVEAPADPDAEPATADAEPATTDAEPAESADDGGLRKRVQDARAELASRDLPEARQRELRQQLAADRKRLRARVAAREERRQPATDAGENAAEDDVTFRDATVIVERRTPSERLNERQLERRIRTLRVALQEERVDRQRAEVAERILLDDRRALAERLRRERDRRRAELVRLRDRNELRIDFNVAVAPPPIIAAAEVDYQAIETQLVAPPRRPPAQRYTYEEIIENEEVREAMPGIDIDTLNFDFGSAEVRPEEIDKLDRVGEALERILTARPDEVFIVEGNTDAVGTDTANLDLSRARAEAVKTALTEYFLIEPDNLRVVGLGERYLKIPTEEPEEENRRVTVRRITPLLTGEAG